MSIKKERKLGVAKKLILFALGLSSLLAFYTFFIAKELPSDSKILVKSIRSENIMDDILKNKDKYENMPCFELNFGNSKYCFDRSKSYIEQKYSSSTTKKDEAVSLYFAAEDLLPLKRENKFVNIYWNIDKYSQKGQTYPEWLSKNSIKKELKNNFYKDSRPLFDSRKDIRISEITDKMRSDLVWGGQRQFIILLGDKIVIRIRLGRSNDYYKYAGKIIYQLPQQETFFEFQLVTNQKTEKEFFQTAFNIAEEFNQYLKDSKLN